MKKIPLYIGILLIVIWGANRKVVSSIDRVSKVTQKLEIPASYLKKLESSKELTMLTWEEFYQIFRPQFSKSVTDAALHQLYTELKKQDGLITVVKD